MEIVHIVLGKANPERMNGVNKVVYQLASKQADFGHNVSVWGITGNLERNFPNRNFQTKLFLKKLNPFSLPKYFRKEVLMSNPSTVFHLHGGWIPVFYTISKFLAQHHRKFVITPHGSYNTIAMEKSSVVKKAYFEIFEKKLLKGSHKIHSIGESEVKGLEKIFPNSKNALVPYGFENSKSETTEGNENKEIIFGFIGRIDIFTKGLDLMVDAFAQFLLKNINSKLWIVGDGIQMDELRQRISRLNLGDKVVLLGSKFGQEKEYLLSKMDIFLHPSRNEGLPVSIIEAASFGKPCIVSEQTNFGSWIQKYNAGIVMKQFSVEQLCSDMLELQKVWTHHSEFATLGENAKNMVKMEFGWPSVILRLKNEVYGNQ